MNLWKYYRRLSIDSVIHCEFSQIGGAKIKNKTHQCKNEKIKFLKCPRKRTNLKKLGNYKQNDKKNYQL